MDNEFKFVISERLSRLLYELDRDAAGALIHRICAWSLDKKESGDTRTEALFNYIFPDLRKELKEISCGE